MVPSSSLPIQPGAGAPVFICRAPLAIRRRRKRADVGSEKGNFKLPKLGREGGDKMVVTAPRPWYLLNNHVPISVRVLILPVYLLN